jgi:sensor histidine kinase YesM
MTIPGSVFDEEMPQNITYTPIDAFVINKLYADDFHEQLKEHFVQRFSYRQYLVIMYANELYSILFVLALIIPSIILIKLMLNGAFKPHNWSWIEYNKQGLYLIFCFGLYMIIQSFSLSDLTLAYRFPVVITAFLQALAAINLIYFAERLILSKQTNTGASKVVTVFLITLIGITIPSTIYFKEYSLTRNTMSTPAVTNISFAFIFLFAIARSLYVFLNDRYKSILNQKDVELAQMSALHKQAELQSLRAKINPHFLYNALNSIASLATTDGHRTEQMALSLSDFFKYAINREQKQLNTLSEELNAIRTYLEIEKVRFGERLNFEIDCPADLLEVQIPQLLIQPLVENALKHGLSQITDKGFIKVSASKLDSLLKIRVYDNGPAFPEGPLSGFGIQNTQERIALVYGAKAGIKWQNKPDKFIEISLPVNNK